jgi:hypothetical protein
MDYLLTEPLLCATWAATNAKNAVNLGKRTVHAAVLRTITGIVHSICSDAKIRDRQGSMNEGVLDGYHLGLWEVARSEPASTRVGP